MNASGQPVVVDDVAAPARPQTDLDRLIAYVNGRFAERDAELVARQRQAAELRLKGDVITLGFEAIDFRRELGGWVALTRRLRDEHFADAMDNSHDERTQMAKADELKRANAKLVETRAKSFIAPLNECLERFDAVIGDMTTIISWCQSLQRAVRDDEFGSLYESGNEVPEELFQAPIGAKLKELSS